MGLPQHFTNKQSCTNTESWYNFFMDSKIARIERHEFCERLVSALTEAGCPPAPTALAREFNVRADGATVTVHAARKWLVGDSFPTQEKLHVLSRWLHVSPQWLRYGEPPTLKGSAANDAPAIPHKDILLLADFKRLDERSQTIVRELIRSLQKLHNLNS